MCGIVAVWNRDRRPLDLAALQNAVASLRHRGPDDEGYVLVNTESGRTVECAGDETRTETLLPRIQDLEGEHFDLALGHRRLAIVDRSTAGHQPMQTSGATWIVHNGMIYNFLELRRELEGRGYVFKSGSDTEVVLRSYDAWGEDCVLRFNGTWALAIWDALAQRLFLARDRFGVKPLVIRADGRLFAAASEIKALMRLVQEPEALDREAVHHYLSLMKVPAPLTIYERIRKVMPGHSLSITRDASIERRYWKPGDPPGTNGEREAQEEVHQLLTDSVRLRLRADVPVATLLSGGIDSSIVSALAARMSETQLSTYSVGSREHESIDESPWAEMVADHIGARHRALEFPRSSDELIELVVAVAELCDEPFAVSSILGVYLIAREASREVNVVLTGDGGDEVFAGYTNRYLAVDQPWERSPVQSFARLWPARVRASSELVRWRTPGAWTKGTAALAAAVRSEQRQRDDAFNLIRLVLNDAEKRSLYTPEWDAATRGMSTLRWLGATLPEPDGDPLRRRQLQDVLTSLHDEMLAKVDTATMAWGVEARSPFLDHRLVDVGLNLPRDLKVHAGRGKRILRWVGKEYLPAQVLERRKQGFNIPLSDWLRGPLRAWVRDVLSPSALRQSGVVRPRAVEQVLAYHDANPLWVTAHMIFTLLCLQLWLERRKPRAS